MRAGAALDATNPASPASSPHAASEVHMPATKTQEGARQGGAAQGLASDVSGRGGGGRAEAEEGKARMPQWLRGMGGGAVGSAIGSRVSALQASVGASSLSSPSLPPSLHPSIHPHRRPLALLPPLDAAALLCQHMLSPAPPPARRRRHLVQADLARPAASGTPCRIRNRISRRASCACAREQPCDDAQGRGRGRPRGCARCEIARAGAGM